VEHACNPSTYKAETGASQNPGKPGPQSDALSQKGKNLCIPKDTIKWKAKGSPGNGGKTMYQVYGWYAEYTKNASNSTTTLKMGKRLSKLAPKTTQRWSTWRSQTQKTSKITYCQEIKLLVQSELETAKMLKLSEREF
jgi:hypothetical protein